METSSFQFTSPQTLSIKADLPCDPQLNTYFLQVMLGALIQHQDLRLLLWQDKLGSPTIIPFGLHWDLPEQKHLSLIPLWHFIVSIWQPLLRIHTWPTDHTFPERLTFVAPAASQVNCWEFMETKGSAAAYYLLWDNHFIQCQSTYFFI